MDRHMSAAYATTLSPAAAAATSQVSPSAAAGAARLPPLRQDLEIKATGVGSSGSPVWTIHDPLQQRYFQIDHHTRELLSLWSEELTVSGLAQLASARMGLSVDDQQLAQLLEFVRNSNLADEDRPGSWSDFSRREAAHRRSLLTRFAHKYLFFKIPLLRPQRLLKATVPFLKPLYTWQAVEVIAFIGLIGFYLTSRQWATFLGTFQDVFSFEGAVYFALSLVLLKSAHELGHALTASRFGCYVPNMGIAFMLMMPFLYTDVTDSWRLSSRRQRLLIGVAGIAVELALACIATFLWVFLPDGSARGIAFMVATTGWVMSIAFNLNPCMKFDGYYLLSDLVEVDNLQPRAFALGRWKVRQILFAPGLEPPELLSRRLRNGLIFYAWSTWIYRLILFTTIAILVYYFSFKLLGIALFLLEIWYLIAKPIVAEFAKWRKIAPQTASLRRVTVTAGAFLSLLLLLVVPWSTRIEVPAILEAADLVQVYPPRAAEVVRINARRGGFVHEFAPIITLNDREIESKIADTKIRIDITRLRLARTVADRIDREESLVLTHELASLQTKLGGLQKQKDDLTIRSPASGTVLELDPDLHPGRWIGKSDRLALVAAQKRHVVRGYVSESSLYRLTADAEGLFIPDDLTRSSIPVRLKNVARGGAVSIDIPALASTNGGQIAVQPDSQQKLVPLTAQYLVELEPQALDHPLAQVVRGVVDLNGAPESFMIRAWRQVSTVLIRESGF
jgi:putative peptide zinc metalloprotease protein